MKAPRSQKDEPLEALRGLAAFAVVFWHLLLGFAPARTGILPGHDPALSWIGLPWYGLVNGNAAVAFFFVLSGFVLTRHALRSRDAALLARGALKRWPRLAGPVVASCLFSWLLFALGLHAYRQAAAVTGSPWLAEFGYSGMLPGLMPDFGGALAQGLVWTFLRGDAFYNSSLWTMRWEFLGSFAAFGLALALLQLTSGRARAALVLVTALMLSFQFIWLAAFPIGVGLALLSAEGRLPRLGWGMALPLLGLALAAAGYSEASRAGRQTAAWLGHPLAAPLVHSIGAVCLLVAVECHAGLHRALSGRLARWLGQISFPVYLLHLPVLCSAGSAAFLLLGGGRAGFAAAIAATLLLTLMLSWPLARFDAWWTAQVGRVALRASGPARARQMPAEPVAPGR